jgi:hypothetical protein
LIVLALEARPRIVTLARVEDQPRLLDWLRGDPRVADLLGDALRLIDDARAADDT